MDTRKRGESVETRSGQVQEAKAEQAEEEGAAGHDCVCGDDALLFCTGGYTYCNCYAIHYSGIRGGEHASATFQEEEQGGGGHRGVVQTFALGGQAKLQVVALTFPTRTRTYHFYLYGSSAPR